MVRKQSASTTGSEGICECYNVQQRMNHQLFQSDGMLLRYIVAFPSPMNKSENLKFFRTEAHEDIQATNVKRRKLLATNISSLRSSQRRPLTRRSQVLTLELM